MRILFMMALLFSISPLALAVDETGCRIIDSKEFQQDGRFSIDIHGEGIKLFTFCSSESLNKYFITIDSLPSSISTLYLIDVDAIPIEPQVIRDVNIRKKSWVVGLTPAKYKHLHGLLSKSVAEDMNDSVHGLDGAVWCLFNSEEKKICHWAPTYNTSGRGLSRVVELGDELCGLVEF
jgi:hypothetical protein